MFQEGRSGKRYRMLQTRQIKAASVFGLIIKRQEEFQWELHSHDATFKGYFSLDSLVSSEKSTQTRF